MLHISDCEKLATLPRGLESLVNLQLMRLAYCAALDFVMDDLLHVSYSLRGFKIVYCPMLRKIPSSLEECSSLETRKIQKCPMIESSPTNISKLRRLGGLRISCHSVKHLISVLETAQYLPLLWRLEIEGFRDDRELMLWGRSNIKTLPQQLGFLSQITELYIWYFEDLEELPTWICNLPSLGYLVLEDGPSLKGLPSKEDLKHLIYLRTVRCPRLLDRYAKDDGCEWHDISHIRKIVIDGKTIQDLEQ